MQEKSEFSKGARSGHTDGSQCDLERAAAEKAAARPHPWEAKSTLPLQDGAHHLARVDSPPKKETAINNLHPPPSGLRDCNDFATKRHVTGLNLIIFRLYWLNCLWQEILQDKPRWGRGDWYGDGKLMCFLIGLEAVGLHVDHSKRSSSFFESLPLFS